MLEEDCNSCFKEVQDKVDKLVNTAKNSIVSMNHAHHESLKERDRKSDEFYENQALKHKEFLDTQEKRQSRRDNLLLFILGCFASVIGYTSYLQWEFKNDMKNVETLKANKNEVLRIDDAKTINDFTNKYSESRYVLKEGAIPDPSNYKMLIETLFERASRGGIKNN